MRSQGAGITRKQMGHSVCTSLRISDTAWISSRSLSRRRLKIPFASLPRAGWLVLAFAPLPPDEIDEMDSASAWCTLASERPS